MRLSSAQVETIKQEAEYFLVANAEMWLFGSRVDDPAKGGDVLSIDELDRLQGVRL